MSFLGFYVFPTQAQLEHFVRFEVRLLEDAANFHSFTRIQNTIRVQMWIRNACGVKLNRETSVTQCGGGVLVSKYAPSIHFRTGKSFIRVFFVDLLCWKINALVVVVTFFFKIIYYQSIHQLIHPLKSLFCTFPV